MGNKVSKNWFLIALAACFWVGYQFADSIAVALQWPYFRSGIVFAVMMAMGVTLRPDAIRRSLQRPAAAIVAIASNTLLVPLLALPTWFWLPADQFGGLFVAALVPCTLASASVWTRKADGDDSIAILTTVVTNLACFVVVPVGLAMVLARQSDVSAGEQIAKLASIVVAPLVLAQVLRRISVSGRSIGAPSIGDWADQRKLPLSMFAQVGILVMVMLGAAQSVVAVDGETAASSSWTIMSWITLIASVCGVHFVAMGIAIGLAKACGIPRSGQIACGIAGSQKTLMVGLQIAIDCGVSVLPMLIYHVGQLLIDTVIAERWKTKSKNHESD
ncbi:Sodium Bile acid symporter family protein [Rubripirellula obstinata]|uniref:Sodium Bile acid symporter family protein n=2 Tax=Rubripirellula obstinata TaxID=406547 RepID=A0A5B1CHB9_9BACT|nr:bile acid:sodium symporter [Rubripirellula obstinata]KAA1260597.1 Sodium Bile acid symporter family protein [Rubripirellula obstinata]